MDCSTLKPGDICIARNGRDVEYIGKAMDERYVFSNNGDVWTTGKDGCLLKIGEAGLDIISKNPQKKILEGWINIYPEGSPSFHLTYDSARSISVIARIFIKQEYTEGEGL